LETLYKDKKGTGLEILAFPANNFGGQEPGTNAEIKAFCSGADSKYSVTFPLFAKISVLGEDQHPLFKTLTAQPSPIGGDPKWNFTKFLVDRTGKVRARFDSRIRPDDSEFVRQLDQLLAEPVPAGIVPAGQVPAAQVPATSPVPAETPAVPVRTPATPSPTSEPKPASGG